jgi:hypothetical protein
MRQPGYYWVKVDGKWTIGEFRVISDVFAEWHILLERWSEKELIENNDLTDTGIEEIDENRIERAEKVELKAKLPAYLKPGSYWDEELGVWIPDIK